MITVEKLEKNLKQEKLDSLYLFYGEELFLLESALKKIKKLFGKLVTGINYITIDDTNYKELLSDIETPSFGYEKKLIIVRNSGLLKKEGRKKSAELVAFRGQVNDYIKKNIEMIKQTIVLVFIEEDIDKSELFKTIDKEGSICQFSYQKPAGIAKRIKQICIGYHVQIDDNTIQYFIETCGTSMQDLINEIRKLIEYAGENGTITKQEIEQLSIKQIEAVIFDLTDQLGKKNIKEALEILNNLVYQKEPIQKILITLYHHFKKLYFVKLAQKYNQDIVSTLNLKPNQMFLVNKYKMQSNAFEENELKSVMEELINLDHNYKIGLIDLNIGLESILCRYCS